jgi:hypothetical protein
MPNGKGKKKGASPPQAPKKSKAQKRAKRLKKNVQYAAALPLQVQSRIMNRARENPLALAIMLPEHSAIRFPTTDAPRTSVMVAKDQLTVTTANVTPLNWNTGDLLLAVYGQPARLFCAYTSLPSGGSSICSFGTGTGTWILEPAAVVGTIEPNVYWPLVGCSPNTGVCPHGRSHPIGSSQTVPFIFLNVNDNISILSNTYTSSTLAGKASFQIYNWVDGESEPQFYAQVDVTLGATSFTGVLLTATVAAHYCVKFTGFFLTGGSITSANTGITVSIGYGAAAGWMIKGMGDIDINNSGDYNLAVNCRRNGFSLLATNTTSILNRQGTVVAARVKDFDFTTMTPSVLSRTGEKYTGDAAKGVYTFLEYTSEAEKFDNSVTAANLPVYSLDTQDYYHFIQLSCPSVSTAPNTYTVTLATNLEFKTEVARYSKDVSYHQFNLLLEARGLVNSTPDWFFENPDHMRRIYNIAKKAFSSAVRIAPLIAQPAAKIASTVHPAGAPAYAALARLMSGMSL